MSAVTLAAAAFLLIAGAVLLSCGVGLYRNGRRRDRAYMSALVIGYETAGRHGSTRAEIAGALVPPRARPVVRLTDVAGEPADLLAARLDTTQTVRVGERVHLGYDPRDPTRTLRVLPVAHGFGVTCGSCAIVVGALLLAGGSLAIVVWR